jgi:peptidoglycan/xylan/chitin deacetylase (PgdA/CDA1 family)
LSTQAAHLDVITYHYVRDLPHTAFPRIKGMLTDEFRRQLDVVRGRYEMATLESALDFLAGRHRPRRDLCLLTFDDGLKDHYTNVLSILAENRIQGVFFLATGCLEDDYVLPVHKNHYLLATLDFCNYRAAFLDRMTKISPQTDIDVDAAKACRVYRWDSPDVAVFKYTVNFKIDDRVREQILDDLFIQYFGDEKEFARQLYVSWEEAQVLQTNGMLIGGHSHRHLPLAKLNAKDQLVDLATCASVLRGRLSRQETWPFSYPYGKPDESFTPVTSQTVRDLGFSCAFSTESGSNYVGHDEFRLRRIDPKDVIL